MASKPGVRPPPAPDMPRSLPSASQTLAITLHHGNCGRQDGHKVKLSLTPGSPANCSPGKPRSQLAFWPFASLSQS